MNKQTMQTSGIFMLIMKSTSPCYMKHGTPDFQQMHKEDLLPLTALYSKQHPLSSN